MNEDNKIKCDVCGSTRETTTVTGGHDNSRVFVYCSKHNPKIGAEDARRI